MQDKLVDKFIGNLQTLSDLPAGKYAIFDQGIYNAVERVIPGWFANGREIIVTKVAKIVFTQLMLNVQLTDKNTELSELERLRLLAEARGNVCAKLMETIDSLNSENEKKERQLCEFSESLALANRAFATSKKTDCVSTAKPRTPVINRSKQDLVISQLKDFKKCSLKRVDKE